MTDGRAAALDTPLRAGQTRVVPRMSTESTRRLGSSLRVLHDETLAEVDGPWGVLRISMDGSPLSVRAQVDGQRVATLTAIAQTTNEEGPIETFKRRDVPVVLGPAHGGVRFVAQGSRLRPAGRRRFLRVTCPDRAWTYGATETQTATRNPLGKVLGSLTAATELRRGPDPSRGALATSSAYNSFRDEKDPRGETYITVSWPEGTTVEEVVLTVLLQLGTNWIKLTPLWWRAVDLSGTY